MEERVSVVGLGKLGLGLALCIADAGFETLGVDLNENLVREIEEGHSPIIEPGYGRLIKETSEKFSVTTSHIRAIDETDLTFILVATPSIGDGRFSNRYVISALESLAAALKESSKDNHTFVISSTVVPGSTEEEFIPLIEEKSGRKLGQGFEICFDPDFVAIGSVVKDFKNPDLVIIGESSEEAGRKVAAIHRAMCENEPKYAHMSLISGEVAKVCLNAYVTTKISFTNSVANLCEKIEGADVDAITEAIGADRRISPHYFRGGLAFGGTCFPRDTKALMTISERYGVDPALISAVEEVNNEQNRHLADVVRQAIGPAKKVGVLGLAFKDKTPVIDESPAIHLIRSLIAEDIDVTVFDPVAMHNVEVIFGDEITFAGSIEQCLEAANTCVITLMSRDYKKAVEEYSPGRSMTIVDCWRQIDVGKCDPAVRVRGMGRFEGNDGES